MNPCYTRSKTPLGIMTLQANNDGLLGAWFEVQTTQPTSLGCYDAEHPVLCQAMQQLKEYFSGKRTVFTLPLAVQGTDFQQQVWAALRQIPFGEIWTYQQLAEWIGKPKAVRAVGLANGRNPVSVIVPCQRVIGKSGKLTGYAGGVERKAQLLKLETGTDFWGGLQ